MDYSGNTTGSELGSAPQASQVAANLEGAYFGLMPRSTKARDLTYLLFILQTSGQGSLKVCRRCIVDCPMLLRTELKFRVSPSRPQLTAPNVDKVPVGPGRSVAAEHEEPKRNSGNQLSSRGHPISKWFLDMRVCICSTRRSKGAGKLLKHLRKGLLLEFEVIQGSRQPNSEAAVYGLDKCAEGETLNPSDCRQNL